jgi:hypothetical protein
METKIKRNMTDSPHPLQENDDLLAAKSPKKVTKTANK